MLCGTVNTSEYESFDGDPFFFTNIETVELHFIRYMYRALWQTSRCICKKNTMFTGVCWITN